MALHKSMFAPSYMMCHIAKYDNDISDICFDASLYDIFLNVYIIYSF